MSVFAGACAAATQPMDPEERRGEVIGEVFEFSSGGGDLGGQGEWIVRVRGDSMWIANVRRGEATEYGAHRITKDEYKKLWRLVDVADIHELETSTRPGKEKETIYMFSVTETRGPTYSVDIWRDDAREDEYLRNLTRYLAKLIHKYTVKKPQL